MKPLSDVIPQIEMSDAQYQGCLTPVTALRFGEDWVVADGQTMELSDESRSMIFSTIGAPEAYLRKLSRRTQATTLNGHLQRGDFAAAANMGFRGSTFKELGPGVQGHLQFERYRAAFWAAWAKRGRSFSVALIANGGGLMSTRYAIPSPSSPRIWARAVRRSRLSVPAVTSARGSVRPWSGGRGSRGRTTFDLVGVRPVQGHRIYKTRSLPCHISNAKTNFFTFTTLPHLNMPALKRPGRRAAQAPLIRQNTGSSLNGFANRDFLSIETIGTKEKTYL